MLAIAGTAAGAVAWRIGRRRRRRIRDAERDDQLVDCGRRIAGALRAGRSVPQAISFAADEARPPLADRHAPSSTGRCRLGVPVDDAVLTWSRELDTDDARLLAGVLSLHRRTGGDLPAVLDEVAGTLAGATRSRPGDPRADGAGAALRHDPRRPAVRLLRVPLAHVAQRDRRSVPLAGRRDRDRARPRARGARVPLDPPSAGGAMIASISIGLVAAAATCSAAASRACDARSPGSETSAADGRPSRAGSRSRSSWPTFFASRAGRRRLAAIDAEIPQLLDLLAAGSSAGLAGPAGPSPRRRRARGAPR